VSTFKCRIKLTDERARRRTRSCKSGASNNTDEYESDGVDVDEYHA
jgi:hypothetical protein